jgi:hypothetical protein
MIEWIGNKLSTSGASIIVHRVQEYDLPSAEKEVKSKRPQARPYIDAWNKQGSSAARA